MNEYDYIGDKTKNYFTAYLQKCIRWKRWNYLKKKEKIDRVERPLEESLVENRKGDIQDGMNYQIKGLQKPF